MLQTPSSLVSSTDDAAGPQKSASAHERLPPITAVELQRQGIVELEPPPWLAQLHLGQARTNVHCLPPMARGLKRLVDIVVASVLLILTAPIMLLAAIGIKASSRGPVIFTQTRVGLNARREQEATEDSFGKNCRRRLANFGRPFRIYKLRTMHVATDVDGPSQARPGDQRVLPLGRLLRRMRIDELPQLFNVLRGEMSIVGPRPECIEYMEELSAKVPNYLQRLGLKPGLTGIAQIEAGYANDLQSYRNKVAYDLMYLQNSCLRNDLRIMARTIKVVLTGFGAL